MAAASIPFSSLYTNNPVDLFWVVTNSILPICQEYYQHLTLLAVFLLVSYSLINMRRTKELHKKVQKIHKRISKSPARSQQ